MRIVIAAAILAAAGCASSSTTPQDDRQGPPAAKADDSAHRAKLLEIAARYKTYERVDDRMRVAPALCAAFSWVKGTFLSRSDDEATHGRKLYSLYAAKTDSLTRDYTGAAPLIGKKEPLTDQIIVKESWMAEEVKGDPPGIFPDPAGKLPPLAVEGPGGKRYIQGAKGPLFVMYQTDPKDPHADDGWVYGTLTPNGKTVTGVGRLENCMKCHQKAPYGRLFGLPKE